MITIPIDLDRGALMDQNLQHNPIIQPDMPDQHLLHHAFHHSSQPMVITDYHTGKQLYANEAYISFTGYGRKELLGYNPFETGLSEKDNNTQELIDQLKTKGRIDAYSTIMRTKSGNIRYLSIDGRVIGPEEKLEILLLLTDKTSSLERDLDKIHLNNLLEEQNQQYKAFLESTQDLVWLVDPHEFRLLRFNHSFASTIKNTFGTSVHKGMSLLEVVTQKNVDYWRNQFQLALNKGENQFEYNPPGGQYYFVINLFAIGIGEKITGISVYARDISERVVHKSELEVSNKKLSEMFHKSINAISKIGEIRDRYTAGHQRRVQELASAISYEMGLDEDTIYNINLGALIHDIGKIYVPADLLSKPGELTDQEYKLLQCHSENGYTIAKEIDMPWQIPTMILQHHERIDGTGYPQGISGDDILLESRILCVADVVEAMNSHRPYRPALGIEAALEEISIYSGSKYDQDVVRACVRLFREKQFVFQSI